MGKERGIGGKEGESTRQYQSHSQSRSSLIGPQVVLVQLYSAGAVLYPPLYISLLLLHEGPIAVQFGVGYHVDGVDLQCFCVQLQSLFVVTALESFVSLLFL